MKNVDVLLKVKRKRSFGIKILKIISRIIAIIGVLFFILLWAADGHLDLVYIELLFISAVFFALSRNPEEIIKSNCEISYNDNDVNIYIKDFQESKNKQYDINIKYEYSKIENLKHQVNDEQWQYMYLDMIYKNEGNSNITEGAALDKVDEQYKALKIEGRPIVKRGDKIVDYFTKRKDFDIYIVTNNENSNLLEDINNKYLKSKNGVE